MATEQVGGARPIAAPNPELEPNLPADINSRLIVVFQRYASNITVELEKLKELAEKGEAITAEHAGQILAEARTGKAIGLQQLAAWGVVVKDEAVAHLAAPSSAPTSVPSPAQVVPVPSPLSAVQVPSPGPVAPSTNPPVPDKPTAG